MTLGNTFAGKTQKSVQAVQVLVNFPTPLLLLSDAKFSFNFFDVCIMSQLLNGEPVSVQYDPTSPVSFLSASAVGHLKLSTS